MPNPSVKYVGPSRLSEIFGYIKAELDKKVDTVSGKGLSSNDYTTSEKNKLAGIASGAQVNVKSDWNESSSSSDAFILNKPTKLSDFTNDVGYTTNIGTVTQVKVGTTAYDPSSGIVSLPAYPTVPTKVSQLTNDAGYITSYVNTTYSMTRDGTSIKLTPSSGTAQSVSLDSLITNLPAWTATPTDDTYLIRRDTSGTAAYGQVKFSTVWTYINSKVSAEGYTKNAGTVTQVKVGTTAYNPSSGVVSLPAYPTSLPASDVYSWAKASSKPSYTASEVGAAPSSNSLYYCRVVNSSNVSSTDNYALNDLAKQHFAMAMVNNATDNPQGAKKWCHAISMAWSNGTNTSWISQIALGVESGDGLWYRTTKGTIVGAAWKRVIDSSNIGSQSVNYATSAGSATSATSATTASSCSGNAATASKATLLSYTHTNEINFSGGTQATCYFNYRNADTDAAATSANITYKFCNYTSSTDKSTVVSGTFTGKYVNVTNELYVGTSSSVLGTASFYQSSSAYRGIISLNAKLTANRNVYIPNASGTLAVTSINPASTTVTYESGTIRLAKFGNLVICTFTGAPMYKYATATALISDSSFRPTTKVARGIVEVWNTDSSCYPAQVQIELDGKMQVKYFAAIYTLNTVSNSGHTIYGTMCWTVA